MSTTKLKLFLAIAVISGIFSPSWKLDDKYVDRDGKQIAHTSLEIGDPYNGKTKYMVFQRTNGTYAVIEMPRQVPTDASGKTYVAETETDVYLSDVRECNGPTTERILNLGSCPGSSGYDLYRLILRHLPKESYLNQLD